ncbi:MAG: adenylate/guanylate cyclase domain-containing protein [Candidatus Cloacimonetes bacterium]|nr:adenylate/guanylate cyclase domain-containing protein [Candidatus Cloacimonadota bacterium]
MIQKRNILLVCVLVPILAWLGVQAFFQVFRETYHRLETIFLDRLFINRYEPAKTSSAGDYILSKEIGSHGFEPVIVVSIDKYTLENLKHKPWLANKDWNADAWPFDRRITAEAVRRLKTLGASVIGLDLLFIHERNPIEDQDLAQAVSEANNVILASLFEVNADGKSIYKKPYPALSESALGLGFVNVPVDTDGILRKILIQSFVNPEETAYPFALSLLMSHPLYKSQGPYTLEIQNAEARLMRPDQSIAKTIHLFEDNTSHHQMLINYRGPDGTFPIISFADLFEPEKQEALQKMIRGKIVVVGLNHPGLQDMYPTPFFSWNRKQTSGVEIHANALYTILTDSQPSIRSISGLPHFLIYFILALIVTTCTSFFSIAVSISVLFLQFAAYWILVTLLFQNHLLLPVPVFFLALAISYILIITARMVTREKEKSMIRRVFNQYVSNQVVDELLHHPDSLSLGGKALEITTLFSDIRSFTTLSENKSPEQVVHLLNTYFELMVSVITKYNGTINKFIGDAVMVLYGAPVLPDNSPKVMAVNALKTAIEMQETLKASSNPELKQLEMGIGISTGVSVVGNIGAQKHKDYTAIGDKINLASRLQGKSQAFEIIVDSGTYEYCKDQFEFEKLEPFTVKGKSEIIQAYRVIY